VIFSTSSSHALRALAWLAEHEGEDAMLGRELARKVKVPAHYLSKVLATLARAGVLRASRGVRGGYRLARPARRIRLIEVVEPFEGQRTRRTCVLHPGKACEERGHCSAHRHWQKVGDSYVRFLEKTTLADIQGRP
jgi:Rrf2 family protein